MYQTLKQVNKPNSVLHQLGQQLNRLSSNISASTLCEKHLSQVPPLLHVFPGSSCLKVDRKCNITHSMFPSVSSAQTHIRSPSTQSLTMTSLFQSHSDRSCWLSTDCCLEISPQFWWSRRAGYKKCTGLGCPVPIHSKVAKDIPCDQRFEKDSWCFYWNCMGWCWLLSSLVYACWPCKCFLCYVLLIQAICIVILRALSQLAPCIFTLWWVLRVET